MGILLRKYVSCVRLWYIRSCISHAFDFLSGTFDEEHVMLTVELTVPNVQ